MNIKNISLIIAFFVLIGVVHAQELELVGREVHPTWACSYYKLYYKGKNLKTDIFTLGISSYTEVEGKLKQFSIEWWVNDSYIYHKPIWGKCIDELTKEEYDCILGYKDEIRYGKYFPLSTLEIGKLTPSYNLTNIQKQSLLALNELTKKGYLNIRICGKFIPYRKNGVDYVSIEHIPIFKGIEYRQYDWWNGSFWGNRFNATGYTYWYLNDADDKVCQALTINQSNWYSGFAAYVSAFTGSPPNYTVGFKWNYSDTNFIANTSYNFTSSGWHTITLNQSTYFNAGDVVWACVEADPDNPPDDSNRIALRSFTPLVQVIPLDSHFDSNMDACIYETSWDCGYTPVVVFLTNDTYKYGQPWRYIDSIACDEAYIRGERFIAPSTKTIDKVFVFAKTSSTIPDDDLNIELRDSSNNLLASCSISNTSFSTDFEWHNCTLNYEIQEGTIYYLVFSAYDITNGGDYMINRLSNAFDDSLTFNGTDAYYVYDSTSDNGSSWGSGSDRDFTFYFQFEAGAPADNPPNVSLNSPVNDYSTYDTTITFNATATDDYNVANMTLYGNFTGVWQANETKTTSGTEVTETWTKTLSPGYYIWNVQACDNASQCSFASQNYSLTILEQDTTPPTYSSVGHNTTIANEACDFYVTWNDDTALHPNGQWIFSWNASGAWANDSAVNFTSTPETVHAEKTLPSEGTYLCYKFYAKDNASNWAETSQNCFTTTTEDTNPPDIILYSPQNITYATTTIDLNVSSPDGDVDTWWYNLNSGSNITFTPNTTITASEGQNHLVVYVNDTSGNENSTEVYFSVDLTKPTITIHSPENKTYYSSSVPLEVSADEEIQTWYADLGSGNQSFEPNATLSELENNTQYHLYVWGEDLGGNWNYSDVYFFIFINSSNDPYSNAITENVEFNFKLWFGLGILAFSAIMVILMVVNPRDTKMLLYIYVTIAIIAIVAWYLYRIVMGMF